MLASLVATVAIAQTSLEPQIVATSVFKNGHSLVVREVAVPSSGEYTLAEVPRSSLSTFWILTSEGVSLQWAKVGADKKEVVVPPQSLMDLLERNVGKSVVLTLEEKERVERLEGTLLSVGSEAVFLRSGGAIQAVLKSRIKEVRIVGGGNLELKRTVPQSRMRVRVEAPKGGKIQFLTVEPGLNWTPMYWVDLTSEDRLSLICRGSITNMLADLEGVSAKLVSAQPHLPWLNHQDPLFQTYLPGDIQLKGEQLSFDPTDNSIVGRVQGGFAAGMPEAPPGTGVAAEDLYFYLLGDLSLKKGENLYHALFSAQEGYKDVLAWRPVFNAQPGAANQTFWHTLIFKNNSKLPWTDAPASVYDNGELVGQGTLKYTPVGSEVELAFSQSHDVEGDAREEEVSRERGALRREKEVWDLIRVKGTLDLHNLEDEPATVRISHQTEGDNFTSDTEADAQKLPERFLQVNPVLVLRWTVLLPANGRKTVNYEYSTYVRST